MKKIVIVGHPNVGKSTLFNRLCGKKLALTENIPGVTRDWKEGKAQLSNLSFILMDTAGLEGFEQDEIKEQIESQTQQLIKEADGVLFLVDAQEGLISSDYKLADQLRKIGKKVILVANKCEGRTSEEGIIESYRLGLGDPVLISAAHGEGLLDLYDALKKLLPDLVDKEASKEAESKDALETPLRLAIVGRPNAGKSTLINKLLGKERLITGEIPGTTRDAVTIDWEYKGRRIELVDTAGIRKRSKVSEKLEKLAVSDSLKAIRFAQVVVLVVDAEIPLEKQDLQIASQVIEEGRALVIAVNKWDKNNKTPLNEIKMQLEQTLSQIKGVFCIPISALQERNFDALMKAVFKVYDLWNIRIPTGPLNRWLEQALQKHSLPLAGRTRIRIKFATQIKTRPPTFVLFATKQGELPSSYVRYLENSLRDSFGLWATPLRFLLRTPKNPYQDE
jgi:GTP-binding protein